MNIKGKYLERSAYIWIYSAVIIFLLGFLKWFIAIPSAAAAIYALFLIFRKQDDDTFFVSVKMLAAGAGIVIVYMLLCGQGGFFPQLYDWQGRNAQLNDLVNYSWPVYYSNGSAFTYYIGHFLVPALFGKISGVAGARAMLFIYTAAGTYFIWLYIVKIISADRAWKQLLVLVILMFFGNMENLRIIVTNFFVGIFHVNPSGIIHNFTTNYNSFGGVFNQTVCTFLVLCMFFDDDTKIENFLVMGVPMLLFAPFMMCAVIAVFAVGTVKQLLVSKNDIKGFLKRLFSIQNLCVLAVVFPIILIYLSGNVFADKPPELKLSFVSYSGRIIGYILFAICEFLLYSFCIYPRFKKDAYFYTANIILLILPFLHMGLYNDIMTRASTAALFVIMLCIDDFLVNGTSDGVNKIRKLIVCLLIFTTALPCMNYYMTNIKNVSAEIAEGNYQKKWLNEWQTYEGLGERFNASDLKYGYYTFDAKDHFFFKYMARK